MSHPFPGNFQGKHIAATWEALVCFPLSHHKPRAVKRPMLRIQARENRMPPPHKMLAGTDGTN